MTRTERKGTGKKHKRRMRPIKLKTGQELRLLAKKRTELKLPDDVVVVRDFAKVKQ